jgi:hypothetical protein
MKARHPLILVLLLGSTLLPGPAAWAVATCETVVRTFVLDPAGHAFGRTYKTPPDINPGGDVVFVTKAKGAKQSLYKYTAANVGSILVAGNTPSPNGGVFKTFTTPSINAAGDVGFFAKTSLGQGVFLIESGGALEVAGIATGVSPGGGNFEDFPAVSLVNALRQISFVATVSGGPGGVFRYDGVANTVSTVALVGGSAGGGRTFCEFSSVALGDSAATAFIGETQVDCLNNSETPVNGLFLEKGGTIRTVALEGGVTPIGGTTYSKLLEPPDANLLDRALFRSQVTGSVNVTGAFLSDPNGVVTDAVVTTGEIAPGAPGGTLSKLDIVRLANDDSVFLKATIKGAAAKAGIFRFDPNGEALLLRTDPPPTDLFGAGSVYRMFSRMQAAKDASSFVLVAKVKDTVAPKGKTGVFRCTP